MSVEDQWTKYNCLQYGTEIGLMSKEALAARFACADVRTSQVSAQAETVETASVAQHAGEAVILHFPEESAEDRVA